MKTKEELKKYKKEWRRKNPEKISEYKRRYRKKLKLYGKDYFKKQQEYRKKYYGENSEKIKKITRDYLKRHPQKRSMYNKKYVIKLRMTILTYYSKGKMSCLCCGESCLEFLTLEHKNGDGAKHRKQVGGGLPMYRWIINNDYPEIFEVLCMNCNWAKGKYGYCPHRKKVL